MLIKRQVMPRNPQAGIEDRCLMGVRRSKVSQVGQLRVTVGELREELATRLGMLRMGDQELRGAMAAVASRAKKAAKQRKRQEARAKGHVGQLRVGPPDVGGSEEGDPAREAGHAHDAIGG